MIKAGPLKRLSDVKLTGQINVVLLTLKIDVFDAGAHAVVKLCGRKLQISITYKGRP